MDFLQRPFDSAANAVSFTAFLIFVVAAMAYLAWKYIEIIRFRYFLDQQVRLESARHGSSPRFSPSSSRDTTYSTSPFFRCVSQSSKTSYTPIRASAGGGSPILCRDRRKSTNATQSIQEHDFDFAPNDSGDGEIVTTNIGLRPRASKHVTIESVEQSGLARRRRTALSSSI